MSDKAVASLTQFFEESGALAVVTGAGVSTASGIPGYRDRNGEWRHLPPVQYADFVGSEHARKRYWARSFSGWQSFAAAGPNKAHRALAALEAAGYIDTLVTQNVDGLHAHAGSRKVIDLHGRLDTVICLSCGIKLSRYDWQERLEAANPDWSVAVAEVRPDGDVELEEAAWEAFEVPACPACGGVIKPDVVFFGEAVPRARVEEASAAVARSSGLLVVGSSLMVYSGFRFARQALEKQKPIAILNQGRTRADDIAALKLDADCGDILEETHDRLAQ